MQMRWESVRKIILMECQHTVLPEHSGKPWIRKDEEYMISVEIGGKDEYDETV